MPTSRTVTETLTILTIRNNAMISCLNLLIPQAEAISTMLCIGDVEVQMNELNRLILSLCTWYYHVRTC